MNWIETEKGYLVRPSEVESIGIGRKEVTKFVPSADGSVPEIRKTFVFALRIRTKSGETYLVSTHLIKEEAETAKRNLYEFILRSEEERYEESISYRV